MKQNPHQPGNIAPEEPLDTNNGASAQSATLNHAYTGQPDDLHDLFGNESDEEDPLAALRNDPNYSALIRDLEYIASQARLLFEPAQEAPSDEVWNKIQKQLAEEPAEGSKDIDS